MQQKETMLIFSSREICYSSGNFFAYQLAGAFEELGFEAEVCEFTANDDFDAVLQPLLKKQYRAIFDFNSLLPRLVMDDDTPVIDAFGAPFYDYILDHPLFHYNGLEMSAENFHAIVLDEGQADYVRRYHPQLKSVHMLPLGAVQAVSGSRKYAPDHILFMGTYDNPKRVYEQIKNETEPKKSAMKNIIEQRIADPNLPMEQAFRRYLKEKEWELPDREFALWMNGMYAADAYIRDYFRKAALDELLQNHIPVKVIGEGWEKYHPQKETLLTREKPVRFDLSFEKIAQEEILLDVSPIFNRGVHDRVLAGMANHTAVLTDENPYRGSHFRQKETICFYTLGKPGSLRDMAGELMENTVLRQNIQQCAYEEFLAHHTWKCRAEEMLNWQKNS